MVCAVGRHAGYQRAAAGVGKLWQCDAADSWPCVPDRGGHIPGQPLDGRAGQAAAGRAQHTVSLNGRKIVQGGSVSCQMHAAMDCEVQPDTELLAAAH